MASTGCTNENESTTSDPESKGHLKWWQLSLLGIGCTIGTGYFLGSGIGIKLTGPSMIFSFLIAAIGTYIVFHFLAKMTTADPQEGSFAIMQVKRLAAGPVSAVLGIIGAPKSSSWAVSSLHSRF